MTRDRFSLFPFRSPLLRESRLLSLPAGTEMFHFPALPPPPYAFRRQRHPMTGAGFPHSETPGSQPGCRLPGAYRRLQRPSSAPDAKASTVCSSELGCNYCRSTRCSRPLCSSQDTGGNGPAPAHRAGQGRPCPKDERKRPFPQDPTACPAAPHPPPPFRTPAGERTDRTGRRQHSRIASAPQESSGRGQGHSPCRAPAAP